MLVLHTAAGWSLKKTGPPPHLQHMVLEEGKTGRGEDGRAERRERRGKEGRGEREEERKVARHRRVAYLGIMLSARER